jgi:histidine triad (HIT) family protein
MSIFSKIVSGEIPCHKVYEDAHTLAFLDIGPISRGHTLVIPKKPYVTIDECDEETAGALGVAIAKVSAAVRKATGCEALNVLQNNGSSAGQAVMYVHFHLIPHYPGKAGLPFRWPTGKLDDDDAAELKAAIAGAMGADR